MVVGKAVVLPTGCPRWRRAEGGGTAERWRYRKLVCYKSLSLSRLRLACITVHAWSSPIWTRGRRNLRKLPSAKVAAGAGGTMSHRVWGDRGHEHHPSPYPSPHPPPRVAGKVLMASFRLVITRAPLTARCVKTPYPPD